MSENLYNTITDKIIASLEAGVLPWQQPWQATHAAGTINKPLRSTGKPYQGVNVLLLWLSAMEHGYSSPIWLTYQQAHELGGQVRKGEKGTIAVYANTYTKRETDQNGEEFEKEVSFLKQYVVFNVEQIKGLPGHYYASVAVTLNEAERIEEAEQFFARTKAEIEHGGAQAYYRIDQDRIHMPQFGVFKTVEGYYATLAHEITHWTRHPSRLDRNLGRKVHGDFGYGMEELVAEIGAAYLCADLGIALEPRPDHASYIASWLTVLKNDNRAIFTAASHAQRAVDHLHSYSR